MTWPCIAVGLMAAQIVVWTAMHLCLMAWDAYWESE